MTISNTPIQTGGAVVAGAAVVKSGANAIRGLPATGALAIAEASNYARNIALAAGGISLAAMSLIRGGKHLDLVAGNDLDDTPTE